MFRVLPQTPEVEIEKSCNFFDISRINLIERVRGGGVDTLRYTTLKPDSIIRNTSGQITDRPFSTSPFILPGISTEFVPDIMIENHQFQPLASFVSQVDV